MGEKNLRIMEAFLQLGIDYSMFSQGDSWIKQTSRWQFQIGIVYLY